LLHSGALQAEAEQFNSNIPWMVRPHPPPIGTSGGLLKERMP
jgi:hypothetical protein